MNVLPPKPHLRPIKSFNSRKQKDYIDTAASHPATIAKSSSCSNISSSSPKATVFTSKENTSASGDVNTVPSEIEAFNTASTTRISSSSSSSTSKQSSSFSNLLPPPSLLLPSSSSLVRKHQMMMMRKLSTVNRKMPSMLSNVNDTKTTNSCKGIPKQVQKRDVGASTVFTPLPENEEMPIASLVGQSLTNDLNRRELETENKATTTIPIQDHKEQQNQKQEQDEPQLGQSKSKVMIFNDATNLCCESLSSPSKAKLITKSSITARAVEEPAGLSLQEQRATSSSPPLLPLHQRILLALQKQKQKLSSRTTTSTNACINQKRRINLLRSRKERITYNIANNFSYNEKIEIIIVPPLPINGDVQENISSINNNGDKSEYIQNRSACRRLSSSSSAASFSEERVSMEDANSIWKIWKENRLKNCAPRPSDWWITVSVLDDNDIINATQSPSNASTGIKASTSNSNTSTGTFVSTSQQQEQCLDVMEHEHVNNGDDDNCDPDPSSIHIDTKTFSTEVVSIEVAADTAVPSSDCIGYDHDQGKIIDNVIAHCNNKIISTRIEFRNCGYLAWVEARNAWRGDGRQLEPHASRDDDDECYNQNSVISPQTPMLVLSPSTSSEESASSSIITNTTIGNTAEVVTLSKDGIEQSLDNDNAKQKEFSKETRRPKLEFFEDGTPLLVESNAHSNAESIVPPLQSLSSCSSPSSPSLTNRNDRNYSSTTSDGTCSTTRISSATFHSENHKNMSKGQARAAAALASTTTASDTALATAETDNATLLQTPTKKVSSIPLSVKSDLIRCIKGPYRQFELSRSIPLKDLVDVYCEVWETTGTEHGDRENT